MDQVVEESRALGGEEGIGEEETNATALLGLGFSFPTFAEGVFIGERRQDLVGEVVGGGIGVWVTVRVVSRRRDSVHFSVRELAIWFSLSALAIKDES